MLQALLLHFFRLLQEGFSEHHLNEVMLKHQVRAVEQ